MPVIPSWLMMLIHLAIQLGSPYLLSLIGNYLISHPALKAVVDDIIAEFGNLHLPMRERKRRAHQRLREAQGQGNTPAPSDTVKEV